MPNSVTNSSEFFDADGRAIPLHPYIQSKDIVAVKAQSAFDYFPQQDLEAVASAIQYHFNAVARDTLLWPKDPIQSLENVVRDILSWLKSTPGLESAVNSGYLPFILPAGSYPKLLEVAGAAMGLSRRTVFIRRAEYNLTQQYMEGRGALLSSCRWWGKLLEGQWEIKTPLAGIYLPLSMWGWGSFAARKQELLLPDGMFLTSALEGVAALLSREESSADYPSWLAFGANSSYSHDVHPAYDLSAQYLSIRSTEASAKPFPPSKYVAYGLSIIREVA